MRPASGPRSCRVLAVVGVVAVLAMSLGACRSAPTSIPGVTEFRVDRIEFEGVTAFDPRDIEDVLATESFRLGQRGAAGWYNRFALASDLQRVEAFYAMRGYFDAEVLDHEVTFDEDGRHPKATVRIVVDEGLPGYITRIDYDVESVRQVENGAEFVRDLPVQVGTRYDQNAINAARSELRRRLQEESYAYARVDARVYADRANHRVEVYYFFDAGPASRFGEISVFGNRQIPDAYVVDRIQRRLTGSWRQSRLRLAQLDLYDMGVFTYVGVEPDLGDDARSAALFEGRWSVEGREARIALLERMAAHDAQMAARGFDLADHHVDPESAPTTRVAGLLDNLDQIEEVRDPDVAIRVSVRESPGASYRIGGGLGVASGRDEAFARGTALWRNVFAPLNQLEANLRGGYAWLPSFFRKQENIEIEGWIGEAELGFRRPGVLFDLFDLSTSVGVERNLKDDYAYIQPSATIAFDRRLSSIARLRFGYTVDFVNILGRSRDGQSDAEAPDRLSCYTVPDQYGFTHADASLQFDARDNPLQAWDGWYAAVATEVGVDGPIGDYTYVGVGPEVRWYQPLGRRLSLATRLHAETIVDFSEELPAKECLYLGGGDTIRGFAEETVRPYRDDQNDPFLRTGTDGEPEDATVGGLSSYGANVEARIEAIQDLIFLAVFVDAGAVSRHDFFTGGFDWSPQIGGDQNLQVASGLGLRILTPIGPFRLDFGWRLTEQNPSYPVRPVPTAFFLSIGEAF